MLYPGELNDNQRAERGRTIAAVGGEKSTTRQSALFPDDREALLIPDCETVQVRLDKRELRRLREWGASRLGLYVWDMLELDILWRSCLPSSRKGTRWLNMLRALVCYRLIDPGSEFRFHREWYVRSAMGELLGEDDSLAQLGLTLPGQPPPKVYAPGQVGLQCRPFSMTP